MTNREIAQEISNRIGNSPVPFDSVYSIALQIYNELGGEQTQFDSVYSILLEILPLVEGGGGKAIETVDELPEDPAENKDKLFRLDNSEKGVYAAKLLSSETITTNRLPDEQQIGKGYLIDANPEVYKYEGDWTIVCTDGNVTLKCWNCDIEDDRAFFTVDNAETITSSSKIISVPLLNWTDVDLEDKSLNVDNTKSEVLELIENGNTLPTYELIPIPAIYNAPESAQIGNANFEIDGDTQVYDGTQTSITVDGSVITVYKWIGVAYGFILYSTKPASELFFSINDEIHQTFVTDVKFYYDDEGTWTIFDEMWNIHIPQLNAPDSEQVGNAYIVTGDYNGDDTTYKYTGEQVTIIGTNGTFTGYKWKSGTSADDEALVISNTTANNIYCELSNDTQEIWLKLLYDDFDSNTSSWGEGTIYTSNSISVSFRTTSSLEENVNNPELHTVKYQSTETTEEWGWQDIIPTYASDSDIDAMFDELTPTGNTITLIREQNSEQQAEGYIDLLVNTDSETMEYEGNTYYKWVQWSNNTDTTQPAVEDPNGVVLTNTLNITLPFNLESPEFEYYIKFNNEEWNIMESHLHGDYIEKTVQ